MNKENSVLILEDSEKFIIYVRRFFDKLFCDLEYSNMIISQGSCVIIEYNSKIIGQTIKFTYDFLRSDKPYYQVYLEIERTGKFSKKQEMIEVIDYLKNKKEPQTIERTLSLIKEFFSRCLIPVIRGEIWIDEIVKQNKK